GSKHSPHAPASAWPKHWPLPSPTPAATAAASPAWQRNTAPPPAPTWGAKAMDHTDLSLPQLRAWLARTATHRGAEDLPSGAAGARAAALPGVVGGAGPEDRGVMTLSRIHAMAQRIVDDLRALPPEQME